MSVLYPIFISLLYLSVDVCYARSFGVDHVKASNSDMKFPAQDEKEWNKFEVMKMASQEVGRNGEKISKDLKDGESRKLSSSSNLVSDKHFSSVSLDVTPKTLSSDHPIFHSDYDRPKPKPPSHN